MAEIPVLIVGGGPVGLASALMLSRFEIPSLVVEKDATTILQPKARILHTRSVELFREWGLLEAIERWAQPLESVSLHWSTLATLPRRAHVRFNGGGRRWRLSSPEKRLRGRHHRNN